MSLLTVEQVLGIATKRTGSGIGDGLEIDAALQHLNA